MKTILSIACLLLVVGVAVEARPKRSILVAAPVVAATVPVVRTASVVHSNPTTVVKTEQVHAGDRSSYSYSSEVKSEPAVVHHTTSVAAAAPVVAAPVAAVSTVHHTVPTYAYSYGYYPAASYAYYSPYHYVVGK